VTEWDATKGRVTLLTEVTNQGGKPVISGEARLVMSSFLAKNSGLCVCHGASPFEKGETMRFLDQVSNLPHRL